MLDMAMFRDNADAIRADHDRRGSPRQHRRGHQAGRGVEEGPVRRGPAPAQEERGRQGHSRCEEVGGRGRGQGDNGRGLDHRVADRRAHGALRGVPCHQGHAQDEHPQHPARGRAGGGGRPEEHPAQPAWREGGASLRAQEPQRAHRDERLGRPSQGSQGRRQPFLLPAGRPRPDGDGPAAVRRGLPDGAGLHPGPAP